jgi:hypothetical protein
VQAQIQGEEIRVTGKSRDDLQSVAEGLKKSPVEPGFFVLIAEVFKLERLTQIPAAHQVRDGAGARRGFGSTFPV